MSFHLQQQKLPQQQWIVNMKSKIAVINLLLFVIGLSSSLQIAKAQSGCTTPRGIAGACQSIYNCPPLLSIAQTSPLSEAQRQLLLQSQCTNGNGRLPHVCCPNARNNAGIITFVNTNADADSTTRRAPNSNVRPSNGAGNVLPEPPNCGPLSLTDRIYNGNNTALDEYPWMALFEYRDRQGNIKLSCAGSLINQRYILTAAHCLTGRIEQEVGALVRIRLGEYDISSEIDCVVDDCNMKVVQVGIEEVIPHPEFDPFNKNRHNDIGLVRLSQDVSYTDFIKPVCLPLQRTRSAIQSGQELVVSGWGRTLLARQSNIKQHLALLAADQNTCIQKFSTKRITILDSQLCAGGQFLRDSCDGDSGGPLMRKQQNRWFLEGIVSFGYLCGLEDWPAVYTRVSQYIGWIRQNLRP